mmetsp:Transcript_36161/g.78985  ORF Transcript_36161/g.78985 Transcript_36161/m.78985 type:complete len:143 (+) Transcript_36161:34-462(+)
MASALPCRPRKSALARVLLWNLLLAIAVIFNLPCSEPTFVPPAKIGSLRSAIPPKFAAGVARLASKSDSDNQPDQLDAEEEDDDGYEYTQDDLDNHANQLNPNNDEYAGDEDEDDQGYQYTQDDLDNHADQLNPNNDEYGRR